MAAAGVGGCVVAQDPPSLAPSPWRREGGWSQHPWTGISGSPGLGVLQVGPRQRQQASLQLDSNCFSFTFSTGKRGALGVRVKSNITNALWSMMDCCSSKSQNGPVVVLQPLVASPGNLAAKAGALLPPGSCQSSNPRWLYCAINHSCFFKVSSHTHTLFSSILLPWILSCTTRRISISKDLLMQTPPPLKMLHWLGQDSVLWGEHYKTVRHVILQKLELKYEAV